MSVIQENHQFKVPEKGKIKCQEDIKIWENSEAYQEYLGFVISVSKAIEGRNIRDTFYKSEAVLRIEVMLDTLKEWARDIEKLEIPRYGNPAFRTWTDKLSTNASQLVRNVVGEKLEKSIIEIEYYLRDSFGNGARLDYGTGHEMAFVMFLCSLFRIGCLTSFDKPAVGLSVFAKYLDLCRYIQDRYCLEFVGSQGVWTLDDYQFVPFIWGAAQLIGNPKIKPKHIPDYAIAKALEPDNHLFSCVSYIMKSKSGPFREHSNQLWNVSGVHNWPQVHSGLIKMYQAHVLGKFTIVQHTLFGSLFSLQQAPAREEGLPSAPTQGPPSATAEDLPSTEEFIPEKISNPGRNPWAVSTMPPNPLLNLDMIEMSRPNVLMEPCQRNTQSNEASQK